MSLNSSTRGLVVMARIAIHLRKAAVAACLSLFWALPAHAQELWVAPTYQTDTGGVGVGSNTFWPVTPAGVVRLAFGVPNNLQTFQGAKIVLIPNAPVGSSTAVVYVCSAKQSDLVGAACTGPSFFPFTA